MSRSVRGLESTAAGVAVERITDRECLTRTAESEADTSNGDDPGAGAELLAKTVDMCIDGASASRPLNVPHLRHDLFTGDDSFGLAGKEIKEVEFLAGHVDELIIEAHFAVADIDAQWSVRNGLHGGLLRPSSAHDGFDTGDEFTKPVGFNQVVVRAGLQAKDPVQLSAASGDGDDRDVTRGSDATTDFKAVEIGQFKIEQHQVGAVIRTQRPCSGIDALGMVSVSPQAAGEGFCCSNIVFYHEYTQDDSPR